MTYLLALLLAAQDTGTFVRLLGSDDPDIRNEAAQILERRGLPAVPALRRAVGSSDPEISDASRRISERVLRARDLARLAPPLNRIRFSEPDLTPGDVLRKLARETGNEIRIGGGLDDFRLESVDLVDATYWQAVERLLRATPGMYIYNYGGILSAYGDGRSAPVQARGPLMLRLMTVSCGTLGFAFYRDPQHRAAVALEYRIVRARTSTGTVMPRYEGLHSIYTFRHEGGAGGFEFRPDGLKRFQVTSRLYYASRWETIRIRPAREAQSIEADGLVLTYGIREPRLGERGPRVSITASVPSGAQRAREKLRLLAAAESRVIHRDGLPLSGSGFGSYRHTPEGEGLSETLEYSIQPWDPKLERTISACEIAEVELRVVSRWVSVRTDFDLRDVWFIER